MDWINLILFVVGIIFVGIVAWAFLYNLGSVRKINVTPNSPQVINWTRKQFTNGYFRGILKEEIPARNGTTRFDFYPDDVKQGTYIPRPPMQSVVVANEFIIRYPAGTLSSRREQIFLIGRNRSEYPDQMKDTPEGEYLEKEGQFAWLKKAFGKMIKEGDDAIIEALKDYARGNVPKEKQQELKRTMSELSKVMKSLEKQPEGLK